METTYQTRLISEYNDLKVKCEKLEVFIKGDIFKTLDVDERVDLHYQLLFMRNYLAILERRLNRKGLI